MSDDRPQPNLVPIWITMGALLVAIGAGLFYALRTQVDATRELMHSPLGYIVFGGLWLSVCYAIFNYGLRHRDVVARIGPAGPWALLSATAPVIGGFIVLGSMGVVGPWLRDHGGLGIVVYVSAFIIFAGFALLPTYSQAILAGWAFGVWVGVPAALAGFVGASLIGYVVGRRASGERIVQIIDEHPKWRAVRDALIGGTPLKTLGMVTLIRIPPNSPFALTNLILSSVRVPMVTYVVATAVGMAPRTIAAVYIGSQVEDIVNADTKPRAVMIGGLVAMLVVVFVIGSIGSKAIERLAEGQAKAGGTPDDSSSDTQA